MQKFLLFLKQNRNLKNRLLPPPALENECVTDIGFMKVRFIVTKEIIKIFFKKIVQWILVLILICY